VICSPLVPKILSLYSLPRSFFLSFFLFIYFLFFIFYFGLFFSLEDHIDFDIFFSFWFFIFLFYFYFYFLFLGLEDCTNFDNTTKPQSLCELHLVASN